MTRFAIVSSIACISYIYLGILMLVVDKKSGVHRSFAVLCTAFAVWSFGTTGQNLSMGNTLRPLFDRISYTGAELYSLAGAVFFLRLSGNGRNKRLHWVVVVAACLMVVLQFMNWRWNSIADGFPAGFWHIAHHVVINSLNVAGLTMTALWGLRSRYHREKIQARLIVSGTLTGIVLGLTIDFILGGLGYPSLTSSVPLLWMVLICIAILRYGLMRFTPEQVSHEIIAAIDEAVFLIDVERKVSDLNESALLLSGRSSAEKHPISIEDIFVRPADLLRHLATMATSGIRTFSRSELIRTKGGEAVLVRADFHCIVDTWNDPIVTLCICRPERDVSDFIKKYRLSKRESDVLRYAITGSTQSEMAAALKLSLPTIKTHTTSLYNKLGVSSRSGMYALLRDEGLGSPGPG